jgi:hypothetical protein
VLHPDGGELGLRVLHRDVDPDQQNLRTPVEQVHERLGERVGAEELVVLGAQHETVPVKLGAHVGLRGLALLQHRLQAEDGCLEGSEVVGEGRPEAQDHAGPVVVGMATDPVGREEGG